jgi:hypothetical protein
MTEMALGVRGDAADIHLHPVTLRLKLFLLTRKRVKYLHYRSSP